MFYRNNALSGATDPQEEFFFIEIVNVLGLNVVFLDVMLELLNLSPILAIDGQ